MASALIRSPITNSIGWCGTRRQTQAANGADDAVRPKAMASAPATTWARKPMAT